MKLTKIPGHESTKKVQYSWKATTTDMLDQYALFYKEQTGVEVPVKDITEQMILDFMRDDKAFQKFTAAAKKQAPATAGKPAEASAQSGQAKPVSGEKPSESSESSSPAAPSYGLTGSAQGSRNN